MRSLKIKTVYKFIEALEKKGEVMLESVLDDIINVPENNIRKCDYILLIVSQQFSLDPKFYLNTHNITATESMAKKISVYLLIEYADMRTIDVAHILNYKPRYVRHVRSTMEKLDDRIPNEREIKQTLEFLSNRIKTKYGQEKNGNT